MANPLYGPANWDRRTLLAARQRRNYNLQRGVSLDIRRVTAQVATQAAGEVAEVLLQLSKLQAAGVRNSPGAFNRAFTEVGNKAVLATSKSYERTRKSRNSKSNAADELRTSPRDSGGKLGAALRSPNMFEATPNGIIFPNFGWLDSQAKQWYRLNFGAGIRGEQSIGGVGSHRDLLASGYDPGVSGGNILAGSRGIRSDMTYGHGPAKYSTKFFASEVSGSLERMSSGIKLSLSDFRPSPAFLIPYGIWIGPNGKPQSPGQRGTGGFFPQTARTEKSNSFKLETSMKTGSMFTGTVQKKQVSKGIAAWGFLDAGIAVIARDMPKASAAVLLKALDKEVKPVWIEKINASPANIRAMQSGLKRFI